MELDDLLRLHTRLEMEQFFGQAKETAPIEPEQRRAVVKAIAYGAGRFNQIQDRLPELAEGTLRRILTDLVNNPNSGIIRTGHGRSSRYSRRI